MIPPNKTIAGRIRQTVSHLATGRSRTFSLRTKRLSNRWQLIAMYSAISKNIPYLTNTSGGYPVTTLDPNAEINTFDRTWDWSGGVSGAYIFPREVMVSVNHRVISGAAFGRTVQFRGGLQIPSLVVRVEPIGTRCLDTVNIMDLKVEKTLTLSGNKRVGLKVNVPYEKRGTGCDGVCERGLRAGATG